MLTTAILMLMQATPASTPSPEALELGRKVAASGMLARMIPMIASKEAGELIKDHPELTDAEQAGLRGIATERAGRGRERLVDVMGEAYASQLSLADMRAIAAFNDTAPAQHWKDAEPQAIAAAMTALNGLDFKADVMKDVCAKTGRGCRKER